MPDLLIVGANPGRKLSRNVDSILYHHVTEGARVHEFDPGVNMEAMQDGSIRIARDDGKPVWGEDRESVKWLINPSDKGRTMAVGRRADGTLKKGYRLTKGGRVVKAGTTRKRATTRKRKSNPPRRKGGTVAKRKRRSTTRRAAPRRRRRYRRNPPLTARGAVKSLTDGVMHAGFAVLGKAAARAVPRAFSLPQGDITGLLVQAGTAVGVGMVAERVLPWRGVGSYVTAGALMAPIEEIIAGAGIPFISDALTELPVSTAGYPAIRTPAGVGALPVKLIGYPSRNRGMSGYARRFAA